MKRIILGIILALAASVAVASNNNSGCQGNCPTEGGGTATATVTDNSKTYNTNVNTNVNGQDQSQRQSQSSSTSTKTSTSTSTSTKQSQSADNKGNSQTINEAKQRLQAPGMAVGGINASATCMVGTSLGVSFPGGSIGGGTSVRDDICTRIEVAVKMIQVGQAIKDTDMVSDGRDMLRDVYADVRAKQVGEKAKASETQPAFTAGEY